jgi:uncharacterized protein YjbJ (UPF0337 family)
MMDDEHAKGTISKVRGKVEEDLGKATGNRGQKVKGKARQIQGATQQRLGDAHDAVARHEHKKETKVWPANIPSGTDRAFFKIEPRVLRVLANAIVAPLAASTWLHPAAAGTAAAPRLRYGADSRM